MRSRVPVEANLRRQAKEHILGEIDEALQKAGETDMICNLNAAERLDSGRPWGRAHHAQYWCDVPRASTMEASVVGWSGLWSGLASFSLPRFLRSSRGVFRSVLERRCPVMP